MTTAIKAFGTCKPAVPEQADGAIAHRAKEKTDRDGGGWGHTTCISPQRKS